MASGQGWAEARAQNLEPRTWKQLTVLPIWHLGGYRFSKGGAVFTGGARDAMFCRENFSLGGGLLAELERMKNFFHGAARWLAVRGG